jgi:DNA-binding TFAR19-related protein (PDSD5 family)
MSQDDSDLESIKRRKMIEFERMHAIVGQKASPKPKTVDDLTIVKSRLIGRGQEVLEAAMAQYPEATREVVRYIASLYKSGQLNENIPGEDLFEVLQTLGMRVHLDTTITYVKDGKRVPLSQKFKKSTSD